MKFTAFFALTLSTLLASAPAFAQKQLPNPTKLEAKIDGQIVITKNLVKGIIQVRAENVNYDEATQITLLKGNVYVSARQGRTSYINLGDEEVSIKGGRLELQIYAIAQQNDPIKELVANLQNQPPMNYRVNWQYHTDKDSDWSENTALYDKDNRTLTEYLILRNENTKGVEVTHQMFNGVTDDILRQMVKDGASHFGNLTFYGCTQQNIQ